MTVSSAATPSPEDEPTQPFAEALDSFIDRIDSLAHHLRMSMSVIQQVHRGDRGRLSGFLQSRCQKLDEETFIVPHDEYAEYRRLNRRLTHGDIALSAVPRSFLVTLVSEFDAFLGRMVRVFYSIQPDALQASNKPFTFKEIVAFGSPDAIRAHLVDKEVETLLRQSHAEQFESLEKTFGTPLRTNLAVWPAFIELTERRNLFVHNDGIINRQYLAACRDHKFDCGSVQSGDRLEVTWEYFQEARNIVYELAAKMAHVLWRRFSPATSGKADSHFSGHVIYNLLYDEEYKRARELAEFAFKYFKSFESDYTRRALIINRAQAYVWDGLKDEGLRILNEEDWSSAKDELLVGVSALREDMDELIRCMKAIGSTTPPGKSRYRDWPVFKWARTQEPFRKAFEEIFGEPLAVVTKPQQPSDSENDRPDSAVH